MISVSPATRDKLNDVITRLEKQEGRSATHEQLIRALLDGVPLWQLELMVCAYVKQAAARQADGTAGSPSD